MYEVAKTIITYLMSHGQFAGGIFNSRNIVGDPMRTVYNDGTLQIDVCEYYDYIEVFGLSDEDFEELRELYSSLRNARWHED